LWWVPKDLAYLGTIAPMFVDFEAIEPQAAVDPSYSIIPVKQVPGFQEAALKCFGRGLRVLTRTFICFYYIISTAKSITVRFI
jgi:hypothetical protein